MTHPPNTPPSSNPADIVVTGMGIVSPLGDTVEAFWRNLLAGVSGIGELTRFDTEGFACTRGGEVSQLTLPPRLAELAAQEDLATRFLLAATAQAVAQAGLEDAAVAPGDVAIVASTNFGGSAFIEDVFTAVGSGDPAAASAWRGARFQSGADAVARAWGFAGPRQTLSLSCSSGTAALAVGADLIRRGRAKVVVAAGYDAISRFVWLGLGALRTMTQDEIRPFDANRSGTVFSEGAGVLILEAGDYAARRNARPLVRLAGASTNNNAFHLTAPAKQGAGSAAAMRAALAEANLSPSAVDHVNAHGTATAANDVTETQAIKTVFGPRAGTIPVTSVKASLGHMLGAAGSAEAIASVMTLLDGVIPPTINYQTPDPACDLDVVAGVARSAKLACVVSNSAGIGGCNAVAVFQACTDASPGVDTGPTEKSEAAGGSLRARQVKRVVVTGLAPVSAIGVGKEAFFAGLRYGDDGIEELSLFDDPALAGVLVAEIPDFELKEYFAKPKGYLDRSTQLAFAAAALALGDAGLAETIGGERHGIALGAGFGCLETAARFFADYLAKGPRFVKPILFPHTYANTTISMLAIEYGLAGPHLAFASGWTSGSQAIAAAADQIRLGRADVMLTGGVEALSPELLHALQATGWLAAAEAGRPAMCAPFDADHCGLAPGEGAAILVLEEYEHAIARRATIYGELIGVGEAASSRDAGQALGRALQAALQESGRTPDLILAGANGLPVVDQAEAVGIATAFPRRPPLATAIKGMLGETGGAAASLQLVAGFFAGQGVAPPTLNLRHPQTECNFTVVADSETKIDVDTFAVTSTDPDGAASALIVKRHTEP